MPRLIVFEGLDGTGKSSLAERAALSTGFKLIEARSPFFIDHILKAKQRGANEETIHTLYMASLMERSQEIQIHFSQGQSVIIARWLGSFIAGHEYYSLKRNQPMLNLDYDKMGIPDADVVFNIRASLEERVKRISSRTTLSNNDLNSIQDANFATYFEGTLARAYPCLVHIDTTNISLDEATTFIVRQIRAIEER